MFPARSPDIARVKEKMVFAASREALRRRLDGIAFEIQGTDPSEITYSTGSLPPRDEVLILTWPVRSAGESIDVHSLISRIVQCTRVHFAIASLVA